MQKEKKEEKIQTIATLFCHRCFVGSNAVLFHLMFQPGRVIFDLIQSLVQSLETAFQRTAKNGTNEVQ